MLSVKTLLNPKSIAIVGASNDTKKVGGIVLQNITNGYSGKIFPINPNTDNTLNLKTYRSITELPLVPDLVIIAIPAEKALDLLPELGNFGVKNILIFSAGFKEVGDSGKILEQKLLELSEKYQFNILGPNCLGFINNEIDLNATFGKVSKKKGNLLVLSQSGAIATSFFDWAEKSKIGISQFITLGNKSVLNENHFLDYWSKQEIKMPIGLYLESISNGPEFIKLCKEISKHTQIYIIKPGKSKGAESAMLSHTGSLAGSNEILESALREAGVIKCETLEDFFAFSQLVSWSSSSNYKNIAIISNAGGPAVIAADAVEQYGLSLAKLKPETTKRLQELLPRMAGLHNPVDILGDALADRYNIALEEVLKENDVDCVLVILTPQIMTEIEKTAITVGELSKKYQKTVVCSFIGGNQIESGERILNQHQIPNFDYPELAIKALSLVRKITNNLEETQYIPNFSTAQITEITKNQQSGLLDTVTTGYILDEAQINQPSSITTDSLSEAKEFSLEVGWPVVLKVTTKDLLHKSDDGGVITNISSLDELTTQWKNINVSSDKIQVQKQVPSGQELIIGFKKDVVFGDTLFFGAGGKYVSLLGDKNICIFPLTETKLTNLILNSKIYPLLNGYRGAPVLDVKKIVSICLKLGHVFANVARIKEMEINPVILNQSGIFAVDTKIIISSHT